MLSAAVKAYEQSGQNKNKQRREIPNYSGGESPEDFAQAMRDPLGNIPLLKALKNVGFEGFRPGEEIMPPLAKGPDDDWNMPYDLFDSAGFLIHRGKNVLQMTNPGGPGVKPLRGHETEQNMALYGS